MKTWLQPLNYERRYSRFLYKTVRQMHLELLARLGQVPYFRAKTKQEQEIEIAKLSNPTGAKDSDDIGLLIAGMIIWWQSQRQPTNAIFRGYFREVNTFNDNQFRLVVKSQTGMSLPPAPSVGISPDTVVTPSFVLAEKFGENADIYRNEEYVETVKENWVTSQQTYFDKVVTQSLSDAELILRNALLIEAARQIAVSTLDKKFETYEKRATSFGKDQIHSLDTVLTKKRQQALGATDYVWETRRDERVRGNPDGLYPKAIPSHYARQSKIFSWNNPPEGGHPGEAPGCRCSAIMRLPR